MKIRHYSPLLVALCGLNATHALGDTSVIESMVSEGTTNINLRYRYENVEDDSFDHSANANTLRTRLTFTSAPLNNLSFKLEMDDVKSLNEDKYNDTQNGQGQLPVVADPEGTDLNQAFIKYKGGSFAAQFGRQRILLDNQRFVGGVGWRQNEQTYDGLCLHYDTDALKTSYTYVNNVNRIFGPNGSAAQASDWRGDVHLLNTRYNVTPEHTVTGFVYLMDFEEAIANSTDTYGLRYQGDFSIAKVDVSYASQSEAGDNPTDYSADYLHAGVSGKVMDNTTVSVNYEVLGSDDGNAAFKTPLATLHKWQGWADKFLGTPANGIEDMYVGVGTKLGKVKLNATYHDFESDNGGVDLGSEIDAVLVYPLNKTTKTVLKYADYSAGDSGNDARKIWLMLEVSL